MVDASPRHWSDQNSSTFIWSTSQSSPVTSIENRSLLISSFLLETTTETAKSVFCWFHCPFRRRLTDVVYLVTRLNGLSPPPWTFGFYLPPGKHHQSEVVTEEPGHRVFDDQEKTMISINTANEMQFCASYFTGGASTGRFKTHLSEMLMCRKQVLLCCSFTCNQYGLCVYFSGTDPYVFSLL